MSLKDLTKQVFLSYTRTERDLAEAIAEVLRAEGCGVWYDRESIESGSKWKEKLQEVLDGCDSMIALLSPHAYSSSWVREELQHALFEQRFKNRLLPVLTGGAELEKFVRLPWILTRMPYVRIEPQDSMQRSTKRIVREFHKLIEHSGETP